jgi:hypothetical protein
LSVKNLEHFEWAKKGGNYAKSEGREREKKGEGKCLFLSICQ